MEINILYFSGRHLDATMPPSEPVDKDLLAWTKVGVAVALIRFTPPDMSARDYADQICTTFVGNQLKVKKKIEKTGILMKSTKKKKKMDNEDQNPGSLDLFSDSQNETDLSGSMQDSSSGNQSEKSSSADTLLDPSGSEQNSSFLLSVLDLKKLMSLPATQDSKLKIKCESITIAQMQGRVLSDDTTLVSDGVLRKSALTWCQLLNQFPWLSEDCEFKKPMFSIVEQILKILSSPTPPGQFPLHRRHKVFSTIFVEYMCGLPPHWSEAVLESLVDSLELLCGQITRFHLSKSLDVDLFQVGYFMVECLSAAMRRWQSKCLLKPQVLEMVLNRLDAFVFELVYFPLFRQSLSGVIVKIESFLQNKDIF